MFPFHRGALAINFPRQPIKRFTEAKDRQEQEESRG